MKPTSEQVTAEIAKLKELETKVRPYDAFGGDNRAKVRFAIGVLEGRITESQIDETEDDGLRSEGDFTLEWLNGDSDDGSPSENWAPLVVEG